MVMATETTTCSTIAPWSEGAPSKEGCLPEVRFLAYSADRHERYICGHRLGGHGAMKDPCVIIKRSLKRVFCSRAGARACRVSSRRARWDIQLARMHHPSQPNMRWQYKFGRSHHHRGTRHGPLRFATDAHGYAGFAARARVSNSDRWRVGRVPPSGLGFVLSHHGESVGTDDAR